MLAKGTITDFEERIKHQRDLIRHGDYQHLGMLSVISLDKEKDQRLPLAQAKVTGRVIDLMDRRVPLAISPDMQDILLPNGFPKTLPDIVDPNYPGRKVITEKIPFIKQGWHDRATGDTVIGGTSMIVAMPVIKLILLGDPTSVIAQKGWPMLFCSADHFGRHMTFLFDPRKGEGYFVGGKFEFSTKVSRPQSPRYAMA